MTKVRMETYYDEDHMCHQIALVMGDCAERLTWREAELLSKTLALASKAIHECYPAYLVEDN